MKKGNVIHLLCILSGMAGTQVFAEPSCLDAAHEALVKGAYSEVVDRSSSCEDSPEKDRFIGIAYSNLYNADSSLFYLKRAYSAGRDDDTVLVFLSRTLLWKKDSQWSGRLLEQVRDTTWLEVYFAEALLAELQGNYDKAISLYDSTLARDSLYYDARIQKGKVLSWQKNFDAAIRELETAEKSPSIPPHLKTRAQIFRARVLSWQKKLDKALTVLDSVRVRDPENSEALLIQGEILEWQGKFKEAKNTYSTLLGFDSGNGAAKLKLEKLLWVK